MADEHVGEMVRCGHCRNDFLAIDFGGPSPEAPAPIRLDVGAATSPGMVRDNNEDAFLAQQLTWSCLDGQHRLALLAVADGMGGYEAGEVASAITIRTIARALAPLLVEAIQEEGAGDFGGRVEEALRSSLVEAGKEVARQAQAAPGRKGMGATAAVALIRDTQVTIAHVGDCRVYHQHAGQLTQVTRDQTLVARMVELGTLSLAEAARHPARNEVSQAIGKHLDLKPSLYHLELKPDDWMIVACDGLHAHLDGQDLFDAVSRLGTSAPETARQLIDIVNERGGSDNCTVVFVRCDT